MRHPGHPRYIRACDGARAISAATVPYMTALDVDVVRGVGLELWLAVHRLERACDGGAEVQRPVGHARPAEGEHGGLLDLQREAERLRLLDDLAFTAKCQPTQLSGFRAAISQLARLPERLERRRLAELRAGLVPEPRLRGSAGARGRRAAAAAAGARYFHPAGGTASASVGHKFGCRGVGSTDNALRDRDEFACRRSRVRY